MKSKFIFSGLIGLLLVFMIGASVASAQTNLSGVWVLDKSKSTDLPPPLKALSMTITQKGTKVDVLQKFVMNTGEDNFTDNFVLDGSIKEVMLDGPNRSKAKGKRTAKKIDGGFESVDEASFSPAGLSGKVNVKTSRRWRLSGDGKTLTLDITRASDMGTRESHRVFTKA